MSKSTATRDGDGHPGLRIRNQEIRRVRIADILDNPANPRIHPDTQQQALAGAVAELGWYGYPDVFAHPDYLGQYMLSDGHLRRTWLAEHYGQDAEIDVNVTDFTPEEAKLAIATKDPLAAMADYEASKLDDLLRQIEAKDEGLSAMFTALADEHGITMSDNGVELRDLPAHRPPKMSWVLIGVPTVHFGTIAANIEAISKCDGVIIETTVNDG